MLPSGALKPCRTPHTRSPALNCKPRKGEANIEWEESEDKDLEYMLKLKLYYCHVTKVHVAVIWKQYPAIFVEPKLWQMTYVWVSMALKFLQWVPRVPWIPSQPQNTVAAMMSHFSELILKNTVILILRSPWLGGLKSIKRSSHERLLHILNFLLKVVKDKILISVISVSWFTLESESASSTTPEKSDPTTLGRSGMGPRYSFFIFVSIGLYDDPATLRRIYRQIRLKAKQMGYGILCILSCRA